MLGSLTLIFVLCTDTCVASPAYGADRVHVGWGKVVLLNGTCSGYLGLALELNSVASPVLPGGVIRIIYFVNLFLLGLIKFLDYNIKTYINRHCCIHRDLSFSLSGLKVMVSIYGDPMAADVGGSQSPRWEETIFLALAMSTDSLAARTMAALLDIPVVTTLALSLAVGVCMMYSDLQLGREMASRFRCDLSWISDILLMALALMKVLPWHGGMTEGAFGPYPMICFKLIICRFMDILP